MSLSTLNYGTRLEMISKYKLCTSLFTKQIILLFYSSLLRFIYNYIIIYRYEKCWRAVMHEADGVILIYNPDAPSQEQQLNDWFDYFVKRNGLRDEQCMIFAHKSGYVGNNPVSTSDSRFRPRKFMLSSFLFHFAFIYLFVLYIFEMFNN